MNYRILSSFNIFQKNSEITLAPSELSMFSTIKQDSIENAVKFFTNIKIDGSGGSKHKIQQG